MTSITTTEISSNRIPENDSLENSGTTLRRRLIAELTGINQQVQSFNPGTDFLTNEINLWQESFRAALNTNGDVRPIYERYLELLQNILVDSITQTPLDSEALLGSDGNCYAYKTLCLFLHTLPEEYRTRSPFDLENSSRDDFITQPHETARYMLGWLDSHQSRLYSPDIERSFQNLTNELGEREITRMIPNSRNNRLRRIQQIANRRREQANISQAFQEQLVIAGTQIEAEIRNEFETLSQRVDHFANRTMQRLDHIQGTTEGVMQNFHQTLTRMDNEVESLETETNELEDQLSYVNSEIETAKKEDLEVQLSIKKLEIAIHKRNKRKKAALGTALAIIAVCVTATILIQLMSNGGAMVAIVPQKGGASAHLAISL